VAGSEAGEVEDHAGSIPLERGLAILGAGKEADGSFDYPVRGLCRQGKAEQCKGKD